MNNSKMFPLLGLVECSDDSLIDIGVDDEAAIETEKLNRGEICDGLVVVVTVVPGVFN